MSVRVWLESGDLAKVEKDGRAVTVEIGEATLIGSETTVTRLLYRALKDVERASEFGELAIRKRDY